MTHLEYKRRIKKLTQADLAEILMVSQASVSYLEKGIIKVGLDVIENAKSYLGFEGTIQEFLSDIDESNSK
jgi:transcriptional regulator with XRE-family HTH domain